MATTTDRVRVGGSGFTVFTWQNEPIMFAQSVSITGVQPVAPATPIQPLNSRRPAEIITPAASTYGTITCTLTELYNQKIWDRLALLAGSRDIVDIFQTIAARDSEIQFVKLVNPPKGIGRGPYSEIYHNCVIANVFDDEEITISSMQLDKRVEIWYTRVERGQGFTVAGKSDQDFN